MLESFARVLCLLTVAASSAFAHASDQSQVDSNGPQRLLLLAAAKIAETSAQGEQRRQLSSLTDGDSKTPIVLSIKSDDPLSIVFEFGEQTISPEQLVLELGEGTSSPPTVEILVSTLSPHTGFQSLRVARPTTDTGRHEFSFVQTGAKWIQIRISPATDSETVSITELEVLGRTGPPATRYEFKESPAQSLDLITQLKELVNLQVTPDEQSLFADARDGRLDEWTFAEAALIASGVTDRSQRNAYLEKLDRLEAEARQAVNGTNGFTAGQKLLTFLHSKPLSEGYQPHQTDISALLDTATFNCVSSATLYNIVGRRLGLDVRAIEVPDHVFSIVYDGARHADVEATAPQGFNPSRDPRILEQIRAQTGFRHIPDQHPEQRREIREVGLVSIIYYNHGVMHGEKKEYDRALVRYFCALSLDPEFDSAVKNALATLANWGVALLDDDKFEKALAVVAAGLELAPKDATLLNNRTAIWHEHVESAMDAGNDDKALALLRRADEQVPDGNFKAMQSWVFLRPAEEAIEQSRWDDALKLAEAGLSKVDAEAREELQEWRSDLFHRWSYHDLSELKFADAVATLDRGLVLYPNDPRMTHNLGYLTQQWAAEAEQNEGEKGAERVLENMLSDHGKYKSVRDIAESWTVRRVNQLRGDGKFSQALDTVSRGETFVPVAADRLTLRHSVYDSWADALANEGKWTDAMAIYDKALEQHPGDPHLIHNAKATWGQWGRSLTADKKWKQAADVYATAGKKFSDPDFDGNVGYIAAQWLADAWARDGAEASEKVVTILMREFKTNESVQTQVAQHFARVTYDLLQKEQFEQALRTIASGKKYPKGDGLVSAQQHIYDTWAGHLTEQQKWEEAITVYDRALIDLPDNAHLTNNLQATWDQWAGTHIAAHRWKEAADVYGKGLKRFPDDSHLINNATVVWNSWAQTHVAKKQWAEAIKVYDQAIKALPSVELLKSNLKYCQQQAEQ